MKSIRIGNDIRFNWTITRNGEAEDFAGRTLSVLLLDSTGKPAVCHCTAEGNVIKGVFFGKDQHKVGPYRLVMHENLGLDGMSATDFNMAFCLVPMSAMEGGEDEDGMETEDINIESEITAPKTGLSAYEVAVANGYEGTEQEWLESLIGESIYEMMVRTGRFVGTEEEFLQEYQDRLTECLNAAVYARQEGAKIQPALDEIQQRMTDFVQAEQRRAEAESARVMAESERGFNETIRNRDESERKDQELVRIGNENQRKLNETKRKQDFQTFIVEGEGKLNDLSEKVKAKYTKPASGIPESDFSADVIDKLSSSDVLIAEYGVTSYEEVKAAYDAGKIIVVYADGICLSLNNFVNETFWFYTLNEKMMLFLLELHTYGWSTPRVLNIASKETVTSLSQKIEQKVDKTYVDTNLAKKNPRLVQGSNITLTDNADGTQTISAVGGDVIHVNWNDRFHASTKAAMIIVENVDGVPTDNHVRIIPNTAAYGGWLYCWEWDTWRMIPEYNGAEYEGHTYEDWSWGDFINWAEENAAPLATDDVVFTLIKTYCGLTSGLTTADKSNLVAAINEVNAKGGGADPRVDALVTKTQGISREGYATHINYLLVADPEDEENNFNVGKRFNEIDDELYGIEEQARGVRAVYNDDYEYQHTTIDGVKILDLASKLNELYEDYQTANSLL